MNEQETRKKLAGVVQILIRDIAKIEASTTQSDYHNGFHDGMKSVLNLLELAGLVKPEKEA